MARQVAAVVAGAAAGAGATASLSTWSDDECGIITINCAAVPGAAGVLATLTLGNSWSGYDLGGPFVLVTPNNAATAGLGLYATFTAPNTITIGNTTPQGASATLIITYRVNG